MILLGMAPSVLAEETDIPHPASFHSDDPYDTKARTTEFLGCSHRMTVLDRENPFLARVQHRPMNGLGLMSSTYGPAVEIGCSPPIDRVTVLFLSGGTMHIDDGGVASVADPGHGAVLCFHEELTMRWAPGLRQLMLTIHKPLLERYLRNLLDAPLHRPVRFTGGVDLAGSGQGIAAGVRTMRRALDLCGKAGPPPVLVTEIEHGVLTALLLGQRHNYTDAIFSARALPSPKVVRRVVELVESSPERAFTVADLASFAGVSERSLHAAFRRQLGTSPMSYVRGRRLDHAHEELLRLDPSAGVKVIDVALRCGFTHSGRFAAAYRARFGESPSATLRR
jgi:AraC-like DNA-binding protein